MKLLLREVLRKQGRRTEWVAKQLGVTFCTINNWCRNYKKPSYNKVVELAELLNVTIDELIDNERSE